LAIFTYLSAVQDFRLRESAEASAEGLEGGLGVIALLPLLMHYSFDMNRLWFFNREP